MRQENFLISRVTVGFSRRSLLHVVKADGATVLKKMIGCVEVIIKCI